MTADVFGDAPAGSVDPLSPDHVAPLVAYLASPAAERISGQVFVVYGGMVALLAPPTVEARFDDPQWTPEALDSTGSAPTSPTATQEGPFPPPS